MIILENARISNDMLEEIRFWQETDGSLEEDITTIDNAITLIACGCECPMPNMEKEALSIIASLSFIKRKLRLFKGGEDKI